MRARALWPSLVSYMQAASASQTEPVLRHRKCDLENYLAGRFGQGQGLTCIFLFLLACMYSCTHSDRNVEMHDRCSEMEYLWGSLSIYLSISVWGFVSLCVRVHTIPRHVYTIYTHIYTDPPDIRWSFFNFKCMPQTNVSITFTMLVHCKQNTYAHKHRNTFARELSLNSL